MLWNLRASRRNCSFLSFYLSTSLLNTIKRWNIYITVKSIMFLFPLTLFLLLIGFWLVHCMYFKNILWLYNTMKSFWIFFDHSKIPGTFKNVGTLLIQHLEHFPVWVIIFHLPRFPLVASVCVQNCSLLPVLNSSSVYFCTDSHNIVFSPYPAVFMKMGKLYFIPSYVGPLFWIQTHLRDLSNGPVYNGSIFSL